VNECQIQANVLGRWSASTQNSHFSELWGGRWSMAGGSEEGEGHYTISKTGFVLRCGKQRILAVINTSDDTI